ncbi:MAG TPA: hypothetical protein VF599_09795 [Pyrinomonadaceae bacterium]|jgi:hypothetical protein
MNKVLVILFLLLCFAGVSAQQNEDFKVPAESDYPPLSKRANRCEDFVPKNWEIMSKASGDLNKDRAPDCVLVIKGTNAKFLNKNEGLGTQVYDTNPRMLVILFKNSGENQYELAKQSNSFIIIPESPTMSEPFQEVAIKNGVLQLAFEQWSSAGSWATAQMSYKFRFQNGEFVLIGADKTESMRNTGEMETRSYNFLTRKVRIENANFSSDKKGRVKWRAFKLEKLKTFDTLKAPFEWEIEPDYYI